MTQIDYDENIFREIRKHWFFIALEIISSVFVSLIPILILLVLFFTENTWILRLYILAITPLWILFVWMWFFYFWTDYYLDVIIVTDKRIIHTEQNGMFDRTLSSFPIFKVQDVIIKIPGILATFLKFGDIEIKTAGDFKGFIMHNISKPEEAKTAIHEAQKTVYTKPSIQSEQQSQSETSSV